MRVAAPLVFLGLLSVAFPGRSVAGEVAFSDGDFEDADWTAQRISGFPGTFLASHVPAGGNPDAYREVVHESGVVHVAHRQTEWTYDPVEMGRIQSIAFSWDLRRLSMSDGEDVEYRLMLLQGGSRFLSLTSHSPTIDGWTAFFSGELKETQFLKVGEGNSSQLDFSVFGDPIRIGYTTRNSGTETIGSGVDNLSVVVTTGPCFPASSWFDGFGQPPTGQGVDAPVTALGEYDGDLVAGGHFSSGGSTALNRIGIWGGVAWAALGSGVNDAPLVFTSFEGDLIAGGRFTEAGDQPAAYVARWDGSSWSPMGQGMNDEVRALTVFQGDLYAGGEFLIAGGELVAYVARWNGVDWQPVGNGFNGKVEELVEFNGQLVAVGTFNQAEGSIAKHIAVWDGSNWSELGGGTSARVRAAVVADGSLYIGGEFVIVDAIDATRVARWEALSGTPSAVGWTERSSHWHATMTR